MRKRPWLGLLYGNLLMAAALTEWPDPASAQSQAAGNLKCNMLHAEQTVTGSTDLTSSDPNKLTPVNATTQDMILKSGLPCDAINIPDGPVPGTPPVANRQRGFDFYSWLTFIALNSPADNPTGIANVPSRHQDGVGRRQDLQAAARRHAGEQRGTDLGEGGDPAGLPEPL